MGSLDLRTREDRLVQLRGRNVINIQWTLAESQRELNRAIVRVAVCATLIQDVRLDKLIIRAWLTDKNYKQHMIVVGWKKGFANDSESLRNATMSSISMFASVQPPTGVAAVRDDVLYNHFRDTTPGKSVSIRFCCRFYPAASIVPGVTVPNT